jgi:hypothetical protein
MRHAISILNFPGSRAARKRDEPLGVLIER